MLFLKTQLLRNMELRGVFIIDNINYVDYLIKHKTLFFSCIKNVIYYNFLILE